MADDLNKRINVQYILDAEGFNEGLTGINKNLKLSESELKNASAGVQNLSKNSQSLTKVQQALTDKMDLQNKKVQLYKDNIDKVTSKLQENISARDKLKSELDMEQAKLDGATQAYGKESEVTQNCKQRVEELTAQYKEKEKAVQSNSNTIVTYTTNMNKAEAEMKKTQSELNNTNKQLAENQNKWLQAGTSMKTASEKMEKAGSSLKSVGNSLTAGVTAPILAAGAAIYKVGSDFDEGFDKIRAGTGKTGEALNELDETFKQVYGEVPSTIDEASTAVTELTKRVNIQGDGLKDLAEEELRLSKLTGSDLATTIESSTRMFQDAGIQQKDYSSALDYTYRVTQQTGIQIDTLQQLMAQFGGPLRQMGFDWQTSAAMLGKFEKEGVNTELVVGSLRIALGKMAKEGIKDPAKALDEMIKKIKEAGTAGQANALALQMFGAKAGPDMAAAIREGRMDLDGLLTTLKKSPDTINAAAKDTMSLSDKFVLMKNKLAVDLEPVALKLMEDIDKSLPSLEKLGEDVIQVADKFANMSDGERESIEKTLLFAAALGPVINGLGTLVGVGGKVVGLFGKFAGAAGTAQVAASTASAAAGTAAEAGATAAATGETVAASATAAGTATAGAATATAGLGSSLAGVAAAAAPFVAVVGLVAAGGYSIYKCLTEDATPAVDLFQDKFETTSKQVQDANGQTVQKLEGGLVKFTDQTKKAVGAYMALDDGAKNALSDLYTNGTTITDKTASSMEQRYAQMGKMITDSYDKKFNDTYNTMKDFYSKSDVFSAEAENNTLIALQQNNAKKKKEITDYENQIKEIYQRAANDHRALSSTEEQQISDIQSKMRTNAVHELSTSELESKVILERVKDYGSHITAEQASAEIKNANKARDGAVNAANDKYKKTVEAIIKMRDETGTISADQADKMIADAKRQKEQSIDNAEATRSGVVEKIKSMNSDVGKNVDLTTGNMINMLGRFKQWWASWQPEEKSFTYTVADKDVKGSGSGGGGTAKHYMANATGTNDFVGGYTTLHERGYEVYQLPKGTKIYNHDASEDLVAKTAQAVAVSVLNGFQNTSNSNSGSGTINLTAELYIDGKKTAVTLIPHIERQQGMNHKMYGRGFGVK